MHIAAYERDSGHWHITASMANLVWYSTVMVIKTAH